jgi:hypothetical protein
MHIKLLSVQPISLYENGGAGRVLRRLYEGHESNITAVYYISSSDPVRKGPIAEVAVATFPFQRTWMRWHLRTFSTFLREKVFLKQNAQKLMRAASNIECDVLHVINHGPYSTIFSNGKFANKPLWVSFHDHFSTCSTFDDAKKLWDLADRRLMISNELGIEYQNLFGNKEFELITDGVLPEEISIAKVDEESPIVIYFAGLLHIDYLPLFEVLANALDLLSEGGLKFKLILRGTQKVNFLTDRRFLVEYRQDFVSDESIKAELDQADILYLPIKFNLPDFYLYSLSTKMVSYLGASGAILYHGPQDSAACNLLKEYQASVNCTSFDVAEMKERIMDLLKIKNPTSLKAKELARTEFNLLALRKQFWQN